MPVVFLCKLGGIVSPEVGCCIVVVAFTSHLVQQIGIMADIVPALIESPFKSNTWNSYSA